MNRCFTNVSFVSCSVDTLSAQLHCHMDYFYCRHANSTHLPYSTFARNFEFSNLVIRILQSTKSQNFTILLFSSFTQQKSRGGGSPPGPPGLAAPVSAPFTQDIYVTFYLLTGTYFNDVNGGRSILTNSQLKRILFMSSKKKKKKNETKLRRRKKSWKKITAMKVRLQ